MYKFEQHWQRILHANVKYIGWKLEYLRANQYKHSNRNKSYA